MLRAAAGLFAVSIGLLAGCSLPHHDIVMQGTADWVLIGYGGDIAETQPIARQYCARFERQPILGQIKENTVLYSCAKP